MSAAPPRTDAELLQAVPYDVAAFEAVYRAHFRRVVGFAASRCASADDVADVAASTFVRLLTAARHYDPDRGTPGAFIIGVAANELRDEVRRRARRHALVSKLAGRQLLTVDDTSRIEDAIDAARVAAALEPALAASPASERAMLGLVADGHSPAGAAAVLGISRTAGRARLSRVRGRLRPVARPHTEPTEEPDR